MASYNSISQSLTAAQKNAIVTALKTALRGITINLIVDKHQSLPFSRLADRILANAPTAGGSSTGEGSLLGGVGRLLGGD